MTSPSGQCCPDGEVITSYDECEVAITQTESGPSEHWIVKGRQEAGCTEYPCTTRFVDDSELHTVVCCADEESTPDFTETTCEGVRGPLLRRASVTGQPVARRGAGRGDIS